MTPVQTIESVYAAFSRGDIAQIVNMVAPDADWSQPKTLPWGGDYRGPQGAAEFFKKLDATMETVAFGAKENIAAGDEVMSFGVYSGKSRKTGKVGETSWMFRWRVKDGKIVSYSAYEDTAALVAAMS